MTPISDSGSKSPRPSCWIVKPFLYVILLSNVALRGATGDSVQVLPQPPIETSYAKAPAREIKTCLVLQDRLYESYCTDDVDLDNVTSYFWHIFSQLPDEVTVYPSENYFYFVETIAARDIWGNLCLPAGKRERGILTFAYWEFSEFSTAREARLKHSKSLGQADGVFVKEKDDQFVWAVTFQGKCVTFHLHRLRQDPPRAFGLRTNEVFIERTFDESGLQFFLLFNTNKDYFFWVLNEEERLPEQFDQVASNVLLGHRTGFVFWLDHEQPPRKVLAAVRGLSVLRNDYYDGPFDQLADNYAKQSKISTWMERAIPSLKGQIDIYGWLTNSAEPTRVALSCYGTYESTAEAIALIGQAELANDSYQFISHRGNRVEVDGLPPKTSSLHISKPQ